jgi:hypothetical protein
MINMNIKKFFIPEPGVRDTAITRLGEVLYWCGALITLVLIFASINTPDLLAGILPTFIISRALMYILSGR